LDLWPIFGTALLVVFIVAFAFIVWQGRQASHPGSHKTPTDRIALIAASPQPTRSDAPTPEPTASPSPSAQLVDTGATQPNTPAERPAVATSAPTARPTPAPKPTATHQLPTVIINVTPKAGLVALHVSADCNACWDATGIVSYQFNWGDGILDLPQANRVATHVYLVAGTYRITVTAVDSVGLSNSSWTTVTAG
jgi:cytoskeletal protein RodZ